MNRGFILSNDKLLFAQIVEDLARLNNAWIDDSVKNIESLSPCLHKAIMAHERQMLRKIRF